MEQYNEAVSHLKDIFRNTLFNDTDPLSEKGTDKEIMLNFLQVLNNLFGIKKIITTEEFLQIVDKKRDEDVSAPENLSLDVGLILQMAADSSSVLDDIPGSTMEHVGSYILSHTDYLEELFVSTGLNNEALQQMYHIDLTLPSWEELMTRIFYEGRDMIKDLRAPDEVRNMDPSLILSYYLEDGFSSGAAEDKFFKDSGLQRGFEKCSYLLPDVFQFMAQRFADPQIYSRFSVDFSKLTQVQYFIFLKSMIEILVSGALKHDEGKSLFTKIYLVLAGISASQDDNAAAGQWKFDAEMLSLLNEYRVDAGVLKTSPFTRINRVILNFMRSILYLGVDETKFLETCLRIPARYNGVIEILNGMEQQYLSVKEEKAGLSEYLFSIYKGFNKAVDTFIASLPQNQPGVSGVMIAARQEVWGVGTEKETLRNYIFSGTIGGSEFEAKIETELVEDEKIIALDLELDLANSADAYNLEVSLNVRYNGNKKQIKAKPASKKSFHRVYKLNPMIRVTYSLELYDPESGETVILFSAEY